MSLRRYVAPMAEDVQYALRLTRRSPGFSAVVVLILSVGIGVTTAVFSLLDAVVFKNLPVHAPQELVYLARPSFSYPIFEQVRARTEVFSGLFAWDVDRLNVAWTGELTPTETLTASGEIYSTLGVNAVVGRVFGPQDDVPGGGPGGPVAVISYSTWQRRFGGDPAIVGRTIRVEQTPFTIVGVTPPEFFGVVAGLAPEVTIPVTVLATVKADPGMLRAHAASWLHLMGRLRPGVTLAQANAALQVFWPQVLEATTPQTLAADRRARFLSRSTSLASGRTGYSRVRNQFSQPLWVLFSLVGLLLLVGCATLANLLLARSLSRRREIAVRLALGATRGRLLRQLVTESLVLALAGAAAGLLVAAWAGEGLVRLLTTTEEPIALSLALDWRTLAFTSALAIVTAIVFALAPAFRATSVDPAPTLKETAPLAGSRREWRLGRSLVVTQMALSMVLVTGAALFVRSLGLILSEDAGFSRDNIVIVSTDALAAGYRGPRLATFYSQMLDRLRIVPGVQAASLSLVPPISNEMGSWTQSIAVDDAAPLPETEDVFFNAVWPGYFDTIGMRMIRGRDFGTTDDLSGPKTVIVNESLARAYFPGENPLGRRISIGRAAARQSLEIVGVVGDAKYQYLQEPVRRIAYLPGPQLPEFVNGENAVASVRVAGGYPAVIEAMRREIRHVDRTMPLRFETLDDRIRESLVTERVLAILSAALGVMALLLACAGLYGLMAHVVSRRTSEIGVRIALGAARADVLWLILRQSLTLAVMGVAAGVGASLLLGRVVSQLLYGVTAADPIALLCAVTIMAGVTTLAGYLPARRAAGVDPAAVLRRN